MLSNSISAQGRPQIIGRDRQPVNIYSISSSSELSLTGRGYRALSSSVAYFISEYIWANLLLAATVFISVAYPGREGERTMASSFNAMSKRGIDILGSLVGLILTAPFFALLPIIIKLESPGPVFYMQSRVGHNRRRRDRRGEIVSSLNRSRRDRRRSDLLGSPFKVIKFRTMVADAEKKCGPVWATKNDPRITRIGLFLRKTRLDEIPQFVNVLLGQMSLVGPRPERPMFVKELCTQVENYDRRLEVKPGLTGLAQIENGYDSSVASVVRKVHYDLQYIQNFSIWQDVKIMLKTVVVVVTGKGAF